MTSDLAIVFVFNSNLAIQVVFMLHIDGVVGYFRSLMKVVMDP